LLFHFSLLVVFVEAFPFFVSFFRPFFSGHPGFLAIISSPSDRPSCERLGALPVCLFILFYKSMGSVSPLLALAAILQRLHSGSLPSPSSQVTSRRRVLGRSPSADPSFSLEGVRPFPSFVTSDRETILFPILLALTP